VYNAIVPFIAFLRCKPGNGEYYSFLVANFVSLAKVCRVPDYIESCLVESVCQYSDVFWLNSAEIQYAQASPFAYCENGVRSSKRSQRFWRQSWMYVNSVSDKRELHSPHSFSKVRYRTEIDVRADNAIGVAPQNGGQHPRGENVILREPREISGAPKRHPVHRTRAVQLAE
jgi:hypothetical protein